MDDYKYTANYGRMTEKGMWQTAISETKQTFLFSFIYIALVWKL